MSSPSPAETGISVAESLFPVFVLMSVLGVGVYLFGDGVSGGPAQIGMIFAGLITAMVAHRHGVSWHELEEAVGQSIGQLVPALFILLAIGTLIGVWIAAGIIPTLIYYGLLIISPDIFYVAVPCVCALISLTIGSSWTTAGTVGVVFMAIAGASGLSLEITAGGVISGAYFGDKLSPLSDTTNLASGVARVNLFDHIQWLMWTTIPAFIIAVIAFALLSFMSAGQAPADELQALIDVLKSSFVIHPALVIPFLITLFLALKKMPPLPVLMISVFIGCVCAWLFQPTILLSQVEGMETNGLGSLAALWKILFAGVSLSTPSGDLNSLLSRGGMESMLSTIWLIMSAMFFGGMLERSGALRRLVELMLSGIVSARGLMVRAGLTTLSTNIIASDQYLAIVLPTRVYAGRFEERGLTSRNLSRVVEDFGTVTSPLIPWNTCGVYMSAVLGISTFAYLPFCFFNIASPFLSVLFSTFGLFIEQEEEKLVPAEET